MVIVMVADSINGRAVGEGSTLGICNTHNWLMVLSCTLWTEIQLVMSGIEQRRGGVEEEGRCGDDDCWLDVDCCSCVDDCCSSADDCVNSTYLLSISKYLCGIKSP